MGIDNEFGPLARDDGSYFRPGRTVAEQMRDIEARRAFAGGPCPECRMPLDTKSGVSTDIPNGVRFVDVKCTSCESLFTIEVLTTKALDGPLRGESISGTALDEFAEIERLRAALQDIQKIARDMAAYGDSTGGVETGERIGTIARSALRQ